MRKSKYTKEEKIEVDRCNKVRQMLRRAWSRDPKRYDCLREGRRAHKHTEKCATNCRQKYEHKCAICLGWFKQTDVSVDHIEGCGTFLKQEHQAIFADRLFWGELQKLCNPCHKIKSKQENAERRLNNV